MPETYGVPPGQLGLARRGALDGKAYIHCPDPGQITGGGTVLMSIERVEA